MDWFTRGFSLQQMALLLMQKHLPSPQVLSLQPISIVIRLKDYDSKTFIHELILNTLQNRYGVNISQPIFYELQRLRKFIFLFDGFDEMDARANPETISANLRELDKISDIKENKF